MTIDEPLTPYLVAKCTKLAPTTSAWRIALIPLLKLATFRMEGQDRRSLVYFGHVIIKNGIKVCGSVKRDTSQLADSQTSMYQQDLWALPTSMESFIICVRGLASATQLLVHPTAVMTVYITDLFRQLGEFHEVYDCRTSVASLMEVYTEQMTAQVMSLHKFVLQKDSEMAQWLSVVTPALRMALDQLEESTRHWVSHHISQEDQRRRTGYNYKGEDDIDIMENKSR